MQQNTTDAIAKMAWNATMARWKEFMALPVVVTVIAFAIMGMTMQIESSFGLLLFSLIYIALSVFFTVFSTALTKWCEELYNGAKEIDIEKGLRYGLSRFWGVLGTHLLTALKVVLWCFLLILPGYYKLLMYSKSVKISQLEKISGGDANRISEKMITEAGPMRSLGNIMAVIIVSELALLIYAGATILVASIFGMAHELFGVIIGGGLFAAGMIVFMSFVMVYSAYEYLVFRDETKTAVAPMMKVLGTTK